MRKFTVRAISVLALLSLFAGLTSPAYAESSRMRDADHDVQFQRYRPQGGLVTTIDRSNAQTDILVSTAKHNADRLVLRLKTRSGGDRNFAVSWRIMTEDRPRGRGYSLRVDRPHGGDPRLGDDPFKDCVGLTLAAPSARVIRVSIPRSCLADPAWVRVGAVAISYRGVGGDAVHVDDAGRRGHTNPPFSKLGPQLRRG